MVRIKLLPNELKLINRIFKKKINLFTIDANEIFVDKDNKDQVVDIIGDYLVKHGFDKKYNTTSLGTEIEQLQDKFLSFLE